MPKLCYVERKFNASSARIIELVDAICQEYAAQGFTLTLRQTYYQLVARGYIPNKDTEYKRVGSIINDARLAGLIDWSHLEDRTRNLRSLGHWADPAEMMQSALDSYRTDKWSSQAYRPEVWIEKDALVGVIADVCDGLDVPYFSCRGYTSQSEMWSAAMRFVGYIRDGKSPVIFHLGDHDPSGIDMTRDIEARLQLFLEGDGRDAYALEVRRIALTMAQVRQYNPPPNPAKFTDSRASDYVRRYGTSSWELDALDPPTLRALIATHIEDALDMDDWRTAQAETEQARRALTAASGRWREVAPAVLALTADTTLQVVPR